MAGCSRDHLHQSVAYARERNGGQRAPGMLDAKGVPDVDALVFTAIPASKGSRFSEGIDLRVAQLDLDAPHGAQPKPIPMAPVNPDAVARWGAEPGARMRVLTGQHTLVIPLYGQGAGASADEPIHDLLNSVMGRHVPPGDARHDTIVTAPLGSKTALQVTTIGSYEVGMGVYVELAGVNQFRVVTDVDVAGATVTVHPAFTEAPADGATIRFCATYYPVQGNALDTIALRFRMEGREMVSVMCRVSAVEWAPGAEDITQFSLTLVPVGVLRNDANAGAIEEWSRAAGLPVVDLQGEHRISASVLGAAAPVALDGTDLSVSEWSVKWEARMGNCPQRRNVLGADDVGVLSTTCTVTGVDLEGDVVESMLLDEDERTLVVSCGPVGRGQGAAVVLMAAHNGKASLPGQGPDDRQAHDFELRAGAYTLDDASEQPGAPANTKWRLLFPLSEPAA